MDTMPPGWTNPEEEVGPGFPRNMNMNMKMMMLNADVDDDSDDVDDEGEDLFHGG